MKALTIIAEDSVLQVTKANYVQIVKLDLVELETMNEVNVQIQYGISLESF